MKMDYKGRYYEIRRIAKELVFENHALQTEIMECRQQICKRERERELLFEHLLNYEQEKWELDRETNHASAEKNKTIKKQETDRRKRLKAAENLLESMAHNSNNINHQAQQPYHHTHPQSMMHHSQMSQPLHSHSSYIPTTLPNSSPSTVPDDTSGSNKIPKIKIVFQQKGGPPATSHQPVTQTPSPSYHSPAVSHNSAAPPPTENKISIKNKVKRSNKITSKLEPIVISLPTNKDTPAISHNIMASKKNRPSAMSQNLDDYMRTAFGTTGVNITPSTPTISPSLVTTEPPLYNDTFSDVERISPSVTLPSKYENANPSLQTFLKAFHQKHIETSSISITPPKPDSKITSSISMLSGSNVSGGTVGTTGDDKSKNTILPVKKTDFKVNALKTIKQRIDSMNSRNESNVFRNVNKSLSLTKQTNLTADKKSESESKK